MFLLLFSIAFVSSLTSIEPVASLGIGKQGSNFTIIQNCPNSTQASISKIYVDGTQTFLISSETAMTQTSQYNYEYNLTNTTILGSYIAVIHCDVDGLYTPSSPSFLITMNGKPLPGTNLIVAFGLGLIILLFFTGYSILHLVAHMFNLDYDSLDTGKSIGIYFGILALYSLEEIYLGNPIVHDWLLLFVKIALWTNVIIPLISLALVIMFAPWFKNKFWQPPQ